MSKKQEEEFQRLTAQAFSLALSISDRKDAACHTFPPPPLEQARHESLLAFRSTALALTEIFKIRPARAPNP